MLEIIGAIAPVFALIVLGHVLWRTLLTAPEFWSTCDKLTYWVLFPALLFNKISTTALNADFIGPYALVLIGGFVVAAMFALGSARFIGLPGAATSSVLQGSARHNTFIALAVAERLFGGAGLAIAALASSILIPITNVVVVVTMVVLHPSRSDGRVATAILRDVARNPLIIGVLVGVLVNILGLGRMPVLHETTDLLGRAALPIVLLSIGASIRVREIGATPSPIAIALIGKLLVFPLAILALVWLTGLTGVPASIALIFGSVATASSAYALARLMGGDAPLMASIVTLQTLVSFVTMPLTLLAGGWLIG